MSLLVACLGSENNSVINRIINSKLFSNIYLVGNSVEHYKKNTPSVNGVRVEFISLTEKAVEDMVSDLYVILREKFRAEKIQELDIAVNISSGSGKEHAVVISTLMKLGYGIRLIELDKDGNILEMI